MKILVVGHKQHGKDTVAIALAERLGMTYESSSEIAINYGLFDDYIQEQYPETWKVQGRQAARDMFYELRNHHRPHMFKTIQDFNSPDKTALARLILAQHNIYCGMRCRKELLACKAEGLFDWIIFVDAQGRKEFEGKDSMTILATDANVILGNSGSKADLSDKLDSLAVLLQGTFAKLKAFK